MSTDDERGQANPGHDSGSEGPDSGLPDLHSAYQTKLEVHVRDRHQCLCCRRSFTDDVDRLDADHVVPEGSGGSSLHKNLATLCRDCHEAKTEDDKIAPTIRFTSSGDMSDEEFGYYRHFWDQILPALTEAALGHRVEPLFGLRDQKMRECWHIPLGDVLFCDERLRARDDVTYSAVPESGPK